MCFKNAKLKALGSNFLGVLLHKVKKEYLLFDKSCKTAPCHAFIVPCCFEIFVIM